MHSLVVENACSAAVLWSVAPDSSSLTLSFGPVDRDLFTFLLHLVDRKSQFYINQWSLQLCNARADDELAIKFRALADEKL